jgi:hypothetical protein
MTKESGLDAEQIQGIFLFSKTSRPALGPLSLLFNVYWGFFILGVKQLWHKADNSPHLVPSLGMNAAIPLLLPYCFMVHKETTL